MSYRDPGTVVVPAAPARRRRPLGLYAGIGVGALLLVLALAFGVYVLQIGESLKKPIDKNALLAEMKSVPVFEGAVYDEIQTKIQTRVVLPQLRTSYPSDKAAIIAYKTFSQPDFVVAWYDKEMEDRGFSIHNETDADTAAIAAFQHRYRKDQDLVVVQAQRAPNKEDTSLILARFPGYRGKD